MSDPTFIAESADYGVVVTELQSTITVTGRNGAYGLLNKKTGVIESYEMALPHALVLLEQIQQGLDAAMGKYSGRAN